MTALDIYGFATDLPTTAEGKAVLSMILNGNEPTIDQLFSYFDGLAPEGFTKDDAAADQLQAKLDMAGMPDTFDETKGLDADLAQAAREAERFRNRWERTFAGIFRRHWARRRTAMLAKIRSVQFRRGTPLWEPAGETPLVEKLDLLVDLKAWDRELAQEIETALRDLQVEAIEEMGDAVVQGKAATLPEFILNWIEHALSFNQTARRAVKRVLEAEPSRVEDVEKAVEEHVSATMSMVGDSVATSLATGSVNEAQYDAAQNADVSEHIWFTAKDGRVRPQHRHANLQRVPMDKPFKLRDRKGAKHSMRFPGDITAPHDLWMNCRCVQLFITPASRQSWLRPDGTPIDPYGRQSAVPVAEKGMSPELLGISWKGLPRDGDGDGLIYEGTPRERLAPPTVDVSAIRSAKWFHSTESDGSPFSGNRWMHVGTEVAARDRMDPELRDWDEPQPFTLWSAKLKPGVRIYPYALDNRDVEDDTTLTPEVRQIMSEGYEVIPYINGVEDQGSVSLFVSASAFSAGRTVRAD